MAAASAVASYVKYRQAKAVAAVATEQANRSVAAAERVADAVERIAESAQSSGTATINAAPDRTHAPWALVPIPGSGNVRLRNETADTLYAVQAEGFKIHNSPNVFDTIHPFAGAELSVMRIWHPNDTVRITWHREADRSDPPLEWEDELPPRI